MTRNIVFRCGREGRRKVEVVDHSMKMFVALGNGNTHTHTAKTSWKPQAKTRQWHSILQLTKHRIQAQTRKSQEPGKETEKESVGQSS